MNIGRLFLLGTVALLPATAFADKYDPPVVEKPVAAPPAPALTWTGPYGGITGSYHSGTFGNGVNFPGDGEGDLDGMSFGGVLGYDFQNGNVVFGAELNYGFADITGAENCVNPAFECGMEIDQVASIRGRLGVLLGADQRTLVYATGGFAMAQTYGYTDDGGVVGENGENQTVNGFVYGLGLEHMVSERMSIRGAVLRHDFEAADYLTDVLYTDVETEFTTFELGVMFRF